MIFKSLLSYQFTGLDSLDETALANSLRQNILLSPGALQEESNGWLPLTEHAETMYLFHDKHLLLNYGVESRVLPAAAIKREMDARVKDFERKQGFLPGRAQRREMKENLKSEMLPKAFIKQANYHVWLDFNAKHLHIAASSEKPAEGIVKLLRETLPGLGIEPIEGQASTSSYMTTWLKESRTGSGDVLIDDCVDLVTTDNTKKTAKFANHDLSGDDVLCHVHSGKVVKNMGLSWKDQVSFVLTDGLVVKKIKLLEVEEVGQDAEEDVDPAALFESEFILEVGTLSELHRDVLKLLGS